MFSLYLFANFWSFQSASENLKQIVESEGHSNPSNSDRKATADTSEQMVVDIERPTSDHSVVHEDRNKTQISDNVQIKAAKSEVKPLKRTTTQNIDILCICVYNTYLIYFLLLGFL